MNPRRRGSILIQVLLAAALLGYIAANILAMILQPGMNSSNLVRTVANGKRAEAAVNRLETVWSANRLTCSSDLGAGVSCSGAPGSCTCQCVDPGLPGVSSAGPDAGPCTLMVSIP